jgi:predicted enzyme related to lactoylglutathione lyase
MNNGHIYFEIQADDPKRAITFYSQTFGWKFSEIKGLPIPYWTIETGGSRGGLLQRPAKTPPPQCGTNAFVCSLEVENFDATAKIIEQQGGIVALPNSPYRTPAGKATSSTPKAIPLAFSKSTRTQNSASNDHNPTAGNRSAGVPPSLPAPSTLTDH